ncbi:Galacturonosyltransferase 8 [Camellia lanceoleosa]|uniref:Galacturonosyltransferase 8 n=1 Tax=Camellia lanceoleosa TaxID=1840588 RepID=A0ACC0HGI4_9ERIC|nr:Galacturonosyltransferase 8 [Camellia lanceoleosa]
MLCRFELSPVCFDIDALQIRALTGRGVGMRITKQANNHCSLVLAYASYDRKLKLENSKLVRVFADLSRNYTTLISKLAYRTLFDSDASSIDESLLRQFEKEVMERIKVTRQLISDASTVRAMFSNCKPQIDVNNGQKMIVNPAGTMVPGIKTGRRKRATSGNVLSTSEACAQEIGTPMTFSDETQPPDDTQTVVEETQPGGVGKTRSTRVRGPTLGKGVQKKIARKKGEKLHVYVNRVLNAITGGNATPATNELGLQIRRCALFKA